MIKKREKYLAPIHLEDEVLGKLVLEKSEGLFEGIYNFSGDDITIYIEVEWSSKATWKRSLSVARDFVEQIAKKDKETRKYFAETLFSFGMTIIYSVTFIITVCIMIWRHTHQS